MIWLWLGLVNDWLNEWLPLEVFTLLSSAAQTVESTPPLTRTCWTNREIHEGRYGKFLLNSTNFEQNDMKKRQLIHQTYQNLTLPNFHLNLLDTWIHSAVQNIRSTTASNLGQCRMGKLTGEISKFWFPPAMNWNSPPKRKKYPHSPHTRNFSLSPCHSLSGRPQGGTVLHTAYVIHFECLQK